MNPNEDVPFVETLDLKRLRQLSPPAADLVNLYSQLVKQLIPNEPINGMTHPRDYELQLDGESFVAELRSGRYDQGFNAGWSQDVLHEYRGPLKSVEGPQPN